MQLPVFNPSRLKEGRRSTQIWPRQRTQGTVHPRSLRSLSDKEKEWVTAASQGLLSAVSRTAWGCCGLGGLRAGRGLIAVKGGAMQLGVARPVQCGQQPAASSQDLPQPALSFAFCLFAFKTKKRKKEIPKVSQLTILQ